MLSDFDREINQRGINSLKWEFHVLDGEPEFWNQTDPDLDEDQMISMWVADMDFPAAKPIVEALRSRIDRGIFGYAAKTHEYTESIKGWMLRRHGWKVQSDWVVPTVGIVPALNMIVRQFTEPGDKVLIQRPVYYPFTYSIENNNREVSCNSLLLQGNHYSMDFQDLEARVQDPSVKLMILSNPHNPVGRVWTQEEIGQVAKICIKNDVLVVADEIHGDLIMPGHSFSPFGLLNHELTNNCIICTAPSKSFNLAGLKSSNLLIKNPEIRKRMKTEIKSSGLWGMNPFGIVATQAAYNHCEPWLEELILYVDRNYQFLSSYVSQQISQLEVFPMEATYLAWVDCRNLELGEDELDHLLMKEAKIYLDQGHIFGPEGSGFIRLNLACPFSILEKALNRLNQSLERLNTG